MQALQLSRVQIWGLYRELLKHAQHDPSINRNGIIMAIREEFRDHMHETNERKLHNYLSEAQGGLSRLRSYSKLNSPHPNLNLDMQ